VGDVASGSLFFLFFSDSALGGLIFAPYLGIFRWESITGRFYPSAGNTLGTERRMGQSGAAAPRHLAAGHAHRSAQLIWPCGVLYTAASEKPRSSNIAQLHPRRR
jgi:hypothetical protein